MREKPEWDMVSIQIPLLPEKDIFIFHEWRVGYLHYPTIERVKYEYYGVHFCLRRVGYNFLRSISGVWDMDFQDPFLESEIWVFRIHFWRVWFGFVGSIFKCEIWDLEIMEYEAELGNIRYSTDQLMKYEIAISYLFETIFQSERYEMAIS